MLGTRPTKPEPSIATQTAEQWLQSRAAALMKEGKSEEEAASIAADELKSMERFARPPAPKVPELVEEEKVKTEVAEARLKDDPAREEFVARRTLQLKGAGHTTQVAARMAREEWEAR